MARFRAALELGCCLRSAEGDCSQTPLVSCVSANRKQRVQGRSHGTHRMPDAAATVHNTVGESNGTNGGVAQVAESQSDPPYFTLLVSRLSCAGADQSRPMTRTLVSTVCALG